MEFLFGITLGFIFGFIFALQPSFIVSVRCEGDESGKMFVEYKKKIYRLVRDA